MTLHAITGASGQLGRLTADFALERIAPADLVLLTRDPSSLSAYADRGVAVRRVDFDDADSLPTAFAGVDRLLVISTDRIGSRVAGQQAAIDGAAAAGVSWIGYTSIGDPSDTNPVVVAAEHRATEDHLRASGASWTFLRNAIYAEVFVGSAQAALASGALVTNTGRGASSYVSRADCAAVAAVVLTDASWDGQVLDVTGAESLDADAQAALLSEVSGRLVQVVHVDDEAYAAGLVAHAGMSPEMASAYATFGQGARLGYADALTTVIADLTGRTPVTLRAVVDAALAPAA